MFHKELSTKKDDCIYLIYLLKGGFWDKGSLTSPSVLCQSFIIRVKLGMSCLLKIFSHWSSSCFFPSIASRWYLSYSYWVQEDWHNDAASVALPSYESITRRWEMLTQNQRALPSSAAASLLSIQAVHVFWLSCRCWTVNTKGLLTFSRTAKTSNSKCLS